MELEIFLKGRMIDCIPISQSQLPKINDILDRLEKKHFHEIQEAETLPLYFICGAGSSIKKKPAGKGSR